MKIVTVRITEVKTTTVKVNVPDDPEILDIEDEAINLAEYMVGDNRVKFYDSECKYEVLEVKDA